MEIAPVAERLEDVSPGRAVSRKATLLLKHDNGPVTGEELLRAREHAVLCALCVDLEQRRWCRRIEQHSVEWYDQHRLMTDTIIGFGRRARLVRLISMGHVICYER